MLLCCLLVLNFLAVSPSVWRMEEPFTPPLPVTFPEWSVLGSRASEAEQDSGCSVSLRFCPVRVVVPQRLWPFWRSDVTHSLLFDKCPRFAEARLGFQSLASVPRPWTLLLHARCEWPHPHSCVLMTLRPQKEGRPNPQSLPGAVTLLSPTGPAPGSALSPTLGLTSLCSAGPVLSKVVVV